MIKRFICALFGRRCDQRCAGPAWPHASNAALINPKAGDLFVVTHPSPLTTEQVERIESYLKGKLGAGVSVLVLTGGLRLGSQ